jgi:hypothetical protein
LKQTIKQSKSVPMTKVKRFCANFYSKNLAKFEEKSAQNALAL